MEAIQVIHEEMRSNVEYFACPLDPHGCQRVLQGPFQFPSQIFSRSHAYWICLVFGDPALRRIFQEKYQGATTPHVEWKFFDVAIRQIGCINHTNN